MLSLLHAFVWLALSVPRAVGPLPETIDISTPFAIAGTGGMLDLYARRWSLAALVGGFGFYGCVVAYQLLSTI